MPPPNQHVRLIEHFIGQSMLRFIQHGRLHRKIAVFLKMIRNGHVIPFRIDRSYLFVLALMAKFIPYRYVNFDMPNTLLLNRYPFLFRKRSDNRVDRALIDKPVFHRGVASVAFSQHEIEERLHLVHLEGIWNFHFPKALIPVLLHPNVQTVFFLQVVDKRSLSAVNLNLLIIAAPIGEAGNRHRGGNAPF